MIGLSQAAGCADVDPDEPTFNTSAIALHADVRCFGIPPTIYVQDGVVVGGPLDGQAYEGRLEASDDHDVILGTDEHDLIARGQDDLICTLGGDDTVDPCDGCSVDLGPGDDGIYGHAALIYGGPGDDYFNILGVGATIYGGDGADRLIMRAGDVVFYGGNDDDTVLRQDFAESTIQAFLGPGNDTYRDDARVIGNARVYGGPGNDDILVSGDGIAFGGDGDDLLHTNFDAGAPVALVGGPGDDELRGSVRSNHLDGGPGHDVIIAYDGDGDGEEDFCIRGEDVTGCEVTIP